MTSQLWPLAIQTTRFDPIEAEFTLTLPLDQPLDGAELRGRFNGPRCPYTDTIEIAYPIRPIPGESGLLRSRVIVPEAACWDPTTPFLYHGQVELWHNERLLESTKVAHGLRHLLLKRQGLILNGKRFKVRGAARDDLPGDAAKSLRAAGCNLLLSDTTSENVALWDEAGRLGFFILGQLDGADDELLWQVDAHQSRRTACFGWVLPQSLTRHPQLWHNAMSLLHGQGRKHLIGVRIDDLPLGVLPGHVAFVLCERRHLDDLAALKLPKLVLLRRASQAEDLENAAGAQQLLGWVAKDVE